MEEPLISPHTEKPSATEQVDRRSLKRAVLTLPWTLLRIVGRLIKGFLIALGALVVVGALGYFGFESIVEALDSRY